MNRLNFEKMDKKKLESIDDVLYTVTEGRIVRRRKNPLPALLIGVAGAGLAIWSLTASSMSEHENLASMLMLLGGSTEAYPFREFLDLTVEAFLCIRKYWREICDVVNCMADSGLPCFLPNTLVDLKERMTPELSELKAAQGMQARVGSVRD